MRSDWVLPLCTGSERIKIEGRKAHSAQKPEALLYRVLLSSTDPGDIVLDPFFGTGTTGAVAKKLHRQWIGIEADADYVRISQERLSAINPEPFDEATFDVKDRRRRAPRVPFAQLLELGFINPGQPIYFQKEWDKEARVRPDGLIEMNGLTGSIHQVGRILLGEKPCNGWDHWFVEGADGTWVSIDTFREEARRRISSSAAG
jgi:site-specific DNA-methyltransferase (adenine-specific)